MSPGLCHCPAYLFPHKPGKRCDEWLEEFRQALARLPKDLTDDFPKEPEDAPPTLPRSPDAP